MILSEFKEGEEKMEINVERQIEFVNSLSKRDMKKMFPKGSYCDVVTHQTHSPIPEGYEKMARKKFRSTPEKVLTIRLRTGKDDY